MQALHKTTITLAHTTEVEYSTDGYTITIKPRNTPALNASLYEYRGLLSHAAREWAKAVLDPKAPTGMHDRIAGLARPRIQPAIYAMWCDMVEAAPTLSRLTQAGFVSTLGKPLAAEDAAPESQIWRHPILADRHAARLIYTLCWYDTENFTRQWRAYLDPQGTGYGALNKTLDSLPTGIAAKALKNLKGRPRLPVAIYDRTQLLAYCHTQNKHLAHLIATGKQEHLKQAMALFHPNRTARQIARLPGAAIQNAVEHMNDLIEYEGGKPHHNDTAAAIMRRALRNDEVGAWTKIRNERNYPGDETQFPRASTWDLPPGITFLGTPAALIAESNREHHCVAQYYQRAMAGQIEIYHVEWDGARSTVGIAANRITQNLGTNNAYTKASAYAYKVLTPLLQPEQTETTNQEHPDNPRQAQPADPQPANHQPANPANPEPKRKRKPSRTDWRNPNRPAVRQEMEMRGYADGSTGAKPKATYNSDYMVAFREGYIDACPTLSADLTKTKTWLDAHRNEYGHIEARRPTIGSHWRRYLCITIIEENEGYLTFARPDRRDINPDAFYEAPRADEEKHAACLAAMIGQEIDMNTASDAAVAAWFRVVRNHIDYTATREAIQYNNILPPFNNIYTRQAIADWQASLQQEEEADIPF